MSSAPEFCPENSLERAAKAAEDDASRGLAAAEELLARYDADPRLHFLKGSLLASLRRYGDAIVAIAEAVRLAPEFHIARFQLGFLQFTSGAVEAAATAWSPLAQLPDNHALRHFAQGLQHLARDEFEQTALLLRRGIAENHENPALNGDMQLILDRLPTPTDQSVSDAASSQTHWLLQQSASRQTKH